MKKILILSGKGGTGKTTVCSALIHNLKPKSYCDCDVDAPNLHILNKLNVKPKFKKFYGAYKANINQNICIKCGKCFKNCHFNAIKHLNNQYLIDEISCEGCGLCEYICPVKAISLKEAITGKISLYQNDETFVSAVLKPGEGNSGKLVSEVKKTLFEANPNSDLAIIDGSPGIGCPVVASISGVDLIVIVTEPSLSGLNDLKRIIDTANNMQTKYVVIINKYDVNIDKTQLIENYLNENHITLIGKVPYDENAIKAINQNQSISEYDSKASVALNKISSKILNIIKNEGDK